MQMHSFYVFFPSSTEIQLKGQPRILDKLCQVEERKQGECFVSGLACLLRCSKTFCFKQSFMHLSIKPGLERAKISLFVRVPACIIRQPQQRVLQMSALILITLLPLNKAEYMKFCPGESRIRMECKYPRLDTSMRFRK